MIMTNLYAVDIFLTKGIRIPCVTSNIASEFRFILSITPKYSMYFQNYTQSH